MDRLYSMGVFVAVAEEESFAAAARRLAMSPPAVTRTIAALEAHLGVKLLSRTTRFVRTTDAGQRYLESARRILAEADEADEAAAGVHATVRGQLVVTAPVLFGSMHVMPGIVEFLARYPEVSVSAAYVDRVVNLLEEGIDVGVRIGELPDSTMRAVPVGSVRRVICAAPDYLARHPELREPSDLAGQTIISASAVSPGTEWRLGDGKRQFSVKLRPRLTVSNNAAAIEAALMGFGVTRLMSYQVAGHLATGKLISLFAADEPPALPVHIIHLEGRQASAKVRALVDVLVERLRGNAALDYRE
ncbi:LysR substrate-binding domain-containing protein [Ferribacterium limneticum]|uniref:LysR substrate-binding domain-containing protein n=1 Tax=Ferribacterium limneticum TaxID=76259 RepID=UPI001CFA468F|nr:LysR substrate-binding domain-containing protein [Ferribacterium limneticum]UCV18083.1 LysR family transcriptional regulator [Ferribacterium limneticum]